MGKFGFLWIILTVMVCVPVLHAAQEGKIAGRVTDVETGEILVSVNIVVEGTPLGAASDMEGEFYIINIPVGTYTVVISQVGYTTRRIIGVEIASDHTTRLDVALKSSPILMEEVSVVWEKPPVDLQETPRNLGVTSFHFFHDDNSPANDDYYVPILANEPHAPLLNMAGTSMGQIQLSMISRWSMASGCQRSTYRGPASVPEAGRPTAATAALSTGGRRTGTPAIPPLTLNLSKDWMIGALRSPPTLRRSPW